MEAKKPALALQLPTDVWQRVYSHCTTREWVTSCGLACKSFEKIKPLQIDLRPFSKYKHEDDPKSIDASNVESSVR